MRLRPFSIAILPLVLTISAGAAPAPRLEPRLRVAADSIVADHEFHWVIPVVIANPLPGDLGLDSLALDAEDIDQGGTRATRTRRTDLSPLLRATPTLAAWDSLTIPCGLDATAERAHLTLTLRSHDGHGGIYHTVATVDATPGPRWSAYPSTVVRVGRRDVETVFVPAVSDSGRAPGLLLVHGHASHARLMLPLALRLAQRGVAVMLVSMPGYGRSTGPADLGGPATMAAATAAFEALARQPGVDPERLGAWGLSRGAGVVATLAEQRGDLRAVVLQSGIYDLWAVRRGTALADFPATIVAEAGRDSAGWRARSPVFGARTLRAPVLLLHGEKDTNVPAAQAHGFVDALTAAGGTVDARFFPNGGHLLASGAIERLTFEFLDQRLRGGATRQ